MPARAWPKRTLAGLLAAAVLAGIVISSGCAGTARGSRSSVFQQEKAVDTVDYSLSKANALVVIRYPAIIQEDAEQPYFHAFSIHAIGGEVPPANRTKKVTQRIAQSVIAKSGYYAMSLYRELQRALPADTVLLSPHIILWDRERGLYSRPILAAEQIPSVLTVDFNIYSYPDTSELMESPPVTFGDLVTPLFVVHADRWAQPATEGLLLASEPLLSASWALSRKQSEQELAARLEGAADGWQRPLDFIAFLRNGGSRGVQPAVKKVADSRGRLMAVEKYPVEKIRMDGTLLEDLRSDRERDPFAASFAAGAASRIKRALNGMDHERATFFARQQALARFDPELALAFLARAGGESVRARLQLAEALVEAERKFLSAQSMSLYDGTYLGDFGDKMRQMIEGEYALLQSRRSMARKQNVTAAVAALALAGSVYGATAGGAVGGVALQSFSGVLVLGSIWAMSSTMETRAESARKAENFLTLIAPALDREISVQAEWLESKERITARGFAEFRNKTLTLYQSRIRALQGRFEDDCRFTRPGARADGRWYGGCRDGWAEGRGYGVLPLGKDNIVEFLGAAKNGRPAGIVGVIDHRAANGAPRYLEGRFVGGVPDGVLRVEEPGRKPRLREFRAGKEVGSGSGRDFEALAF